MRTLYTRCTRCVKSNCLTKCARDAHIKRMVVAKTVHQDLKLPREKVVRTNITLPPRLWEAAQNIVRERGYVGLSDYIQARIRSDAGLDSFAIS